jgi:hypothetical protein
VKPRITIRNHQKKDGAVICPAACLPWFLVQSFWCVLWEFAQVVTHCFVLLVQGNEQRSKYYLRARQRNSEGWATASMIRTAPRTELLEWQDHSGLLSEIRVLLLEQPGTLWPTLSSGCCALRTEGNHALIPAQCIPLLTLPSREQGTQLWEMIKPQGAKGLSQWLSFWELWKAPSSPYCSTAPSTCKCDPRCQHSWPAIQSRSQPKLPHKSFAYNHNDL